MAGYGAAPAERSKARNEIAMMPPVAPPGGRCRSIVVVRLPHQCHDVNVMPTLKKYRKLIVIAAPIVLCALFLLIVEAGLRLGFGLPKGQFASWFPGQSGLYPENSVIDMTWGAIPYTVKVNSHGFRGPEFLSNKPGEIFTIAALGDSVTDGFFVDNQDTYPYLLQVILTERYQRQAQVINGARGGASIDKEFAILRQTLLPFKPDMVVLTFVGNDISDIRGKTREQLVSLNLDPGSKPHRELARLALVKTAVGEAAYDRYLSLTRKQYQAARRSLKSGRDRYDIAGGTNFLENVRICEERYEKSEGILLAEPYAAETTALIDNYLFALGEMSKFCKQSGIRLVFVYFPSYFVVYKPGASNQIRDLLQAGCARLAIPFLDLTETFRTAGATKALHLAPVDFHLNPAGNLVLAQAIAEGIAPYVGGKDSTR